MKGETGTHTHHHHNILVSAAEAPSWRWANDRGEWLRSGANGAVNREERSWEGLRGETIAGYKEGGETYDE